MDVPRNSWMNGGWNSKLPQFLPLARWMGIKTPHPTPDELQDLFQTVKPTVFRDAVPEVLEATGMTEQELQGKLRFMWEKLGIGKSIPPRSLKQGRCNPADLTDSVAIVLPGTAAWSHARLQRTLMTEQAGARFHRYMMFGSTRVCNTPSDHRHPYIRGIFPEGKGPTETELFKHWVYGRGGIDDRFVFPESLPAEGPVLSAEKQIRLVVSSGEFAEIVGDRRVFLAINGGNALFIVLQVYRLLMELGVLAHEDIWFTQGATNVVAPVPEFWWPEDQDLMTIPSGIIRLLIELEANGCINNNAPTDMDKPRNRRR